MALKTPPAKRTTQKGAVSRRSAATKRKTGTVSAALQPPVRAPRAVGNYERLAYERHERDLALAAQPGGHPKGFWYDLEAGNRAVQFVENFCRHHKGVWAGSLFVLEPFQLFIVRAIFGWKRADGKRRFRKAYIEIARKNGKTALVAAIAAYLLIADGEMGAEVYATATKEEQAKLAWLDTSKMVKQSPELSRHITIMQKSMLVERTDSFFKFLGGDSKTLDGLNPHGVIADELHAHKTRGMVDIMETAMGARSQPLMFEITTAGTYDPESIGWMEHEHAQKVLECVLDDDETFAIIFAADDDDDWEDPRTWEKANPNIDVSIYRDYLAKQCASAKNKPSFLNTFLRLHLNIWTAQVHRWIPVKAWNDAPARVEPLEHFKGRTIYVAVDLSQKIDISALCIDIPDADTHHLFWKFYVPEELVRQRAIEHKKPAYEEWVRDGFLTTTPGNSIDHNFIIADILKLRGDFLIRQFAYDPWSAHEMMTQLETAHGFSKDPEAKKEQLVEVRQGFRSLSEPSKTLETLVMNRKLTHGDNPVARWMVDNAVVRHDANGNIAPDKRSAAGKIDGVVAAIMAIARVLLTPPTKASIYETRGVRSF